MSRPHAPLGLLLGLLLAPFAGCGAAPEPNLEYPELPAAEEGQGEATEPEVGPDEPLREGPIPVIAELSDSQVITFRVAFEAGSADDPEGREGVTALTAALMAEGGAGELDRQALAEALYPMAAELEVEVGREQTVFVGRVHRDHLDRFYEIFRDVLLRPRMNRDELVRLRDRAATGITLGLRGSDDEEFGKELLEAMLYEAHPYGHPTLGTERGLAGLRLDDVRAQRARVFCAGRATIGLAGAYPEELPTRMQRDLGALHSEACEGRHGLPVPAVIEAPRVWIVHKPEATSVAVSMGFPTDVTRAHPDYPALMLVAAWLGQHRQTIGRLMTGIREERGLNYGDYAYAEHFDQEGWSRFPMPNRSRRQQYFSIWLRPLTTDQAHFAIRFAVRELRRLAREGLTAEQLRTAREFCDAYFALYLQTESRRLGFAIDDAFYRSPQAFLARLRASWAELTPEAIRAVVRRHLTPERLQIALIAPNAEALAEAIATEAPSPITYRAEVREEVHAEDREVIEHRLGIPRDRIRIIPVAEIFRD